MKSLLTTHKMYWIDRIYYMNLEYEFRMDNKIIASLNCYIQMHRIKRSDQSGLS